MYRDWREITKQLLVLKEKEDFDHATVSKARLRRPESKVYMEWAKREIKQNPELFQNYIHGKGIIAVRERFLEYVRSGKNGAVQTDGLSLSLPIDLHRKHFEKTIIMPVAVPGCGKTSIAVALKALFGFGHVQSDDIHFKKSKPHFIKRIKEELRSYDVVVADK